jgi:phasin
MSAYDQSKKLADKSAEMASETVQQGKAAVEQSFSASVGNMRDYNLKMIELAQANIEAYFAFARQLATATTPSDAIELWTSHVRKQFELLNDQTKQLTALGQKLAGESAAPIARSINHVFSKAS